MTAPNYIATAYAAARHDDVTRGPAAPTRKALQDWLLNNDRNGCYHDLETARELQWVASDADILVSVVRVTAGDEVADLLRESLPEDPGSTRKAIEQLLMDVASKVIEGDDDTWPCDWAIACEVAGARWDATADELWGVLDDEPDDPRGRDAFVALVCHTLPGAIASARDLPHTMSDTHACCLAPVDMGHMDGCPNNPENN